MNSRKVNAFKNSRTVNVVQHISGVNIDEHTLSLSSPKPAPESGGFTLMRGVRVSKFSASEARTGLEP